MGMDRRICELSIFESVFLILQKFSYNKFTQGFSTMFCYPLKYMERKISLTNRKLLA